MQLSEVLQRHSCPDCKSKACFKKAPDVVYIKSRLQLTATVISNPCNAGKPEAKTNRKNDELLIKITQKENHPGCFSLLYEWFAPEDLHALARSDTHYRIFDSDNNSFTRRIPKKDVILRAYCDHPETEAAVYCSRGEDLGAVVARLVRQLGHGDGDLKMFDIDGVRSSPYNSRGKPKGPCPAGYRRGSVGHLLAQDGQDPMATDEIVFWFEIKDAKETYGF